MNLFFSYLFPVTLLAFNGTMVAYVSTVLSSNTRWLILGLLAIQQITSKFRGRSSMPFTALLFLYCLWCISTSFWSERFNLTLMKSAMFFILPFTMISAGKCWSARTSTQKIFDYLIPLTIMAYAAGILGYLFRPNAFDGMLFQGYVYGSNMLGAMMAMTMPLILWRCYLSWSEPRLRNTWIVLFLLSTLFVFMSMSRAALLIALLTLSGGVFSLGLKRQVMLAYLILVIAALFFCFKPDVASQVVRQVIYKHGDTVTFSRARVWSESWKQANLGGWFGAGFGVAIGSPEEELTSLKSTGYGREKGNSQLAIIEESGVIGFIFYLLVIFSLFRILLTRYRWADNKDLKVALGLFIGSMSGMIAQSLFEAWWHAPGAPESAAFWALAGCALGLGSTESTMSAKLNTRLS